MKILAIETSCDETAVAVLYISGPLEKPQVKVLGNALFSQAHLHEEYGGVYPNLAKREHIKNLPPLLEKALKEAESHAGEDMDCIAVTEGPGLEPALWVGITFAEDLAKRWSKPLIPTNHMAGHIYSVLYDLPEGRELKLPALALLVSGGHTELVLVKDFGVYEILGRTRDDAVGEAFDKVARLLGLPYPGGPHVSRLAHSHREKGLTPSLELPRPMLHSGDLDFSFSGLKTAVLYALKHLDTTRLEVQEEVARAFEDAAIDVLLAKSRRALEKHPEIKTFIIGGGVAANTHLQESLRKLSEHFPHISFLAPARELATDNAVMIGIAAYVDVSLHKELLEPRERSIQARGNLLLGS